LEECRVYFSIKEAKRMKKSSQSSIDVDYIDLYSNM